MLLGNASQRLQKAAHGWDCTLHGLDYDRSKRFGVLSHERGCCLSIVIWGDEHAFGYGV